MSATTHNRAIARAACVVGGSLSALLAFALLGPGTARADALAITCPAPIVAEATAGDTAFVAPGAASATGDGVMITSPPATYYRLGSTQVTYTATDSSGNTVSCTTTIQVVDTTPPSITCPPNQTATADSSGTAMVFFAATATDTVSGAYTPISYIPQGSGSAFPIGTWTVTAGAADPSGNLSTCTFTVTVTPPAPFTDQILQPLAQSSDPASPVINTGKNGRVIPVKAQISQGGTAITDANAPGPLTIAVSKLASCSTTAGTDPITTYADAGQSSAGTNRFQYDAAAQAWVYNLDTKALSLIAGNCYRIDVSVSGTPITNAFAVYQPTK
jgi:hypothetical protein